LLVHRREGHAALLDIGRNRVDDGVGFSDGRGDGGLVAHVGAEQRDLVQSRCAQGAPRRIRMPHRDAHTRPLGGEALHEPSAEEPSAAEHGDRGHGIACGILDHGGPNGNKRSR
jgi:hypothetical protein